MLDVFIKLHRDDFVLCPTKACGIELESCHAGTSEGTIFWSRRRRTAVAYPDFFFSLNFSLLRLSGTRDVLNRTRFWPWGGARVVTSVGGSGLGSNSSRTVDEGGSWAFWLKPIHLSHRCFS